MKQEINDLYMCRKDIHGHASFISYNGVLSKNKPTGMCKGNADGSYIGYDESISLNWKIDRDGILIDGILIGSLLIKYDTESQSST